MLGRFQPQFTRVFCEIVALLPTEASVVDAGANIGYYACIAADILRSKLGHVFAFEPHPILFLYLKRNKYINV
jgi:protein-L-isoaspartate O-methyltransferase